MVLLTIKEAAAECRCSVALIQMAIRSGELTCIRLGKVRVKRVRPEDLIAWQLGKIEVTAKSVEQEKANLAKMASHLNQWVTPHDR
jgi:excisionase family DNA binding protein